VSGDCLGAERLEVIAHYPREEYQLLITLSSGHELGIV
jgi:hypothetical protein